MYKHNLSIKKIKKHYVSINVSIESSFNKLKLFILKVRKSGIDPTNRVFLIFFSLIVLTLGYFLIPTFYDKKIIQSEIKNQILNNHNIDIQFNEKISYGLLPLPHFISKDVSILNKQKEIGVVKNFKIFIRTNRFFAINQIAMKDLLFKKADFYIKKEDINFFKKVLISQNGDYGLKIHNSNIFYKNKNDEILFINKIIDSNFYYDIKKLENILISKNKVFNVPYKIKLNLNKFNKKISSKFSSKKMRLNIENEINYHNEILDGLLEILLINNNISIDYQINENSLVFSSTDNEDSFEGNIDLKPFYLFANLNYDRINTKSIFRENSIIVDLIKSEIFENNNLNLNAIFNVKDVIDNDQLKNLYLNFSIQEGKLSFSNSNINWKNEVKINLNESELDIQNNNIVLNGKIQIDFNNTSEFYSFFQIKRNYRKKIEMINFDFIYNFNLNEVSFDNVKIDKKSFKNLDRFINEFNSREVRIFNKITFKNFINSFFSSYAG